VAEKNIKKKKVLVTSPYSDVGGLT